MSNGGIIGPVNIPTTNTASGIWTLEEQQLAKTQNIWPTVTSDPYFEYTTLLLPGNGTNGAQNNTFLDSSTNNFTITRNGNTTQGTFSPFSQTGWGNYFNGSSSLTSSSLGTSIGTGDFSLEFFIFQTASAGIITPFALSMDDGNAIYLQTNSGSARLLSNSGISAISGGTVNINTWNHLLATRQGSTVRLFVNGVLVASTTSSTSFTTPTSAYIGGATTLYLTSVRACIGSVPTSYQTSSTTNGTTIFTSPTSLLTTSSQGATAADVKLLTCQSNRFVDISDSPKTFTISGSPTVVAFSPFNPSASWSAATYGGSGYFDGSGDYLTLSANSAFAIGTGNFTFDCWLYPLASYSGLFTMTASGVNDLVISNNWNPNTGSTTSGTASVTFGATTITAPTNAVVQNAWNHIAVVRSGGSVRVYVNGAGGTQTTNTSNVSGSYAPAIGALYTHAASATPACYMSNMRLVKGTAVYDPSQSTITVPTAPTTAITNTSLLLNFTNAGIFDATSKNDLETVGNAQISTAQSKWGGSSIYLDGTGDYLDVSPSRFSSFGTGDFTVEFWMRTAGSSFNIINPATATGTGYWALLVNTGSGGFRWNDAYNSTNLWTQTATSVLDNNWHHIAVVRNGTGSGNVNIYFDGVAQGTAKTDSTNYNGASTAWRIGSGNVGAFNGYIQDLRITPGIARYTANFAGPLLSPFLTL